MSEPITLKILFLGDASTGKTCLFQAFLNSGIGFNENSLPTIGADFRQKVITVNNRKVILAMWDTAGQERFQALTANYYRNAHGAVLVYDVSNRSSFKNIEKWSSNVDLQCYDNFVEKLIVGNKIDLEKDVSTKEGMELARKESALFMECSAKTRENVDEAIFELVEKILESQIYTKEEDVVRVHEPIEDQQRKWCFGFC